MSVLARYRRWRGTRMANRAELVWLLDELLDRLPARWEGQWHARGQWGCRLGLERYWGRDQFRRPQ